MNCGRSTPPPPAIPTCERLFVQCRLHSFKLLLYKHVVMCWNCVEQWCSHHIECYYLLPVAERPWSSPSCFNHFSSSVEWGTDELC